jgi:glycosyltransferase 2 family protein
VWLALRWRAVLAVCGCAASVRDVVPVYFAGEIGKYVPGGIWPVVGRGELAVREGIGERSDAYRSVLLSLVYLVMSGLGVGAVVWLGAVRGPLDVQWWAIVLAAFPVGLVLLVPSAARVVSSRLVFGRMTAALEVPPFRTSVTMIVSYVPTWLLIVASMLCSARAVGVTAGGWVVATAATIPWVIGMLAIPAPGGLGAREAVVGLVLGAAPGQAALLAVASRVAFLTVDVVASLLALGALRRRRPARETTRARA